MSDLLRNNDYRQWLVSIKGRIQSSQIKAAIAVNRELLELYWYLGEQILEKLQSAKWGDGFLEQMSRDLLAEFPEIKGFSYRNLRRIRQWRSFWEIDATIWPQLVAKLPQSWPQAAANTTEQGLKPSSPSVQSLLVQIPWGHNSVILEKLRDPLEAIFYVQKTIENNWSRAVLTHQIESGLHQRQGRPTNCIAATLQFPFFPLCTSSFFRGCFSWK